MANFRITAGPSKWDLLIEALGHGKNIEFSFEDSDKRQVQILSVGPEDGSGESWLITGRTLEEKRDRTTYHPFDFKGWYSTKLRWGTYETVTV